jgi:hypothetical protein
MISRVNLQDFYVLVGPIFPVLDGIFSADMDVNRAPKVIGLSVIRMQARLASNRHEPVSEE